MEANVVYVQRSSAVKNIRLRIVQYLITRGARPDSIKFSNQELKFEYDENLNKSPENWCEELSHEFNGQINFQSKYPQHVFR